MPQLSAVYGIHWDDIVRMPRAELEEYVNQLPEIRRARQLVQMVTFK